MRDLEQERIDYDRRCAAIRAASDHHRRDEIERVIVRYELEPDEFLTAEEKAIVIIKRGEA